MICEDMQQLAISEAFLFLRKAWQSMMVDFPTIKIKNDDKYSLASKTIIQTPKWEDLFFEDMQVHQ